MSAPVTAVTVPKWGIEMQEGTLTAWLVEEGQAVQRGMALAEFETDKIINELEAPASGVLVRQLAQSGETLPVGALIGVVAAAQTDTGVVEQFIAGFKPADASFEPAAAGASIEPATSAPLAAAPADAAASAGSGIAGDHAPAKTSPVVRRLAEQLGVDLTRLTGSGNRGRITKDDVRAAAAGDSQPPPARSDSAAAVFERIDLNATRRRAAERLLAAKPGLPHFYLTADAGVEALQGLSRAAGGLSLNAALMFAVARALPEHPALNSRYEDGELRQYNQVNLAAAVATERGLLTPVVHGADSLAAGEFADRLRSQIDKARQGRLAAGDLKDATFTVSNLGMLGVREFAAIINPPQVAILAVGAVHGAVVERGGDWQMAPVVTLTLSCDHRVIDGAAGAAFLNTLVAAIEAAEFR